MSDKYVQSATGTKNKQNKLFLHQQMAVGILNTFQCHLIQNNLMLVSLASLTYTVQRKASSPVGNF